MTCIVVAAGLDWLEGLLPALFVGFWILSQVFAVFRRLPKGRDPVVVVKPVVPEEEPPPNRERLQKEIEEFLLERRGSSPKPTRRPSRRTVGERRVAADAKQPVVPGPPVSAATAAAVSPPIDTDIALHVEQAFATDLAHAVPSVHSERATTPIPQVTSPLAVLLRDPATIRQVVVLREVLERPTERWR